MAFMTPKITEKQEWAGVETSRGFWWVPVDVLSKSEIESARRGDFEPLLQYTEGGEVYSNMSSFKKGYGVRLSASGYMDATDWEVYGSLKEAQRRAKELAEESEGDHATKKKAGRSKKVKISTSRPIGWTITDPARPGWSKTGTTTSDELEEALQPKRHHATKKSSAGSSISVRKIDKRWQPVTSSGHVVRGAIYNADGTGYSTREGAVEAAAMLRQLAKKR